MPDKDKWILEQWADSYDRFNRENLEFFQEGTDQFFQEYSPKFEGDALGRLSMGALRANSKFTYGFLALSGALVGSVADLLRIGETIRKPSFGAVINDGLRLALVGGAAAKLVRFAYLRAAFKVPGGVNSCTPTGMTMALRMTGTKMFARISDVVAAEIGTIWSEELALSTGYAGSWLKPWLPRLRELGLKLNELTGINDVQRIVSLVKETGKPVLFNAGRAAAAQNNTRVPLHTMLAYKDSKGVVRIADQAGKEFLAEEYLRVYDTLYEIYQLEYAAILHPAAGVAGAVAGVAQIVRRLPFWADLIGVPIDVVDQNFMDAVNRNVRRRLAETKPSAARAVVAAPPTVAGQKPKLVTKTGLTELTFGRVGNSDQPNVASGVAYFYKVKIGDTTFGLAKKFYGDAAKYNWIQIANKDFLGALKPDRQLPVNSEIVIPGN